MIAPEKETVIVAMSHRHAPDRLVQRLVAEGHAVIGPVTTAAMALALAAQMPATMAVVHADLDGGRGGRDLVTTLIHTWGVPSVLIAEP
jgi:hypothetical protein